MRFRLNAVAALFAATPLAAAAAASDAPEAPLNVVVVSATRAEHTSFDLPAAIDVVDADRIGAAQPRVNVSEALAAVPGLVVQNRQNYAQDLQISSRGFGARSAFGVRGVKLIADGIPATMPDGQGQAATFDLDMAERIEVLRGPFSTLYGNHAGGVIQLFTRDPRGAPCGSRVNSWITPPAWLPYSVENGPRKTSMRAAMSRSNVAAWPWPSGIVAGTPSATRRTPRTPNAERAPKPREEICRSCA